MHKLGLIIKEHRIAIIIAILASLITIFPQVYFRIDRTQVDQGIELLPDSPWSARVTEVQNGHPNFGSIYYKDGKDLPYLFQPLGSMVVAYMGKMFSLNINDTFLLSRIILPFLTFLLVYAFVYLLSKDRFAALASSSVLLFADSILSFSGLSRMLHGLSPDSFLRLARPVNPAMIYILLFGFLVSFWLFLRKKDWRLGVLSAVLLGLNFYNYFYSWTYLFAFGGLFGFFLLIQKKWKDALSVTAVYVGALLVAIPYVVNLLRVTAHPAYVEASMRSGIVLTHAPLFVGFFVVLAIAVFVFGYPKEDREKYFFGLALLLAPFLTMNQQLLTGKVLQEAHYHWFFHKPMAVIYILLVACILMSKWKLDFYKKAFAVLIIVVSIGTAAFVQVSSYFNDNRDGGQVAVERQRYGDVVDWLNEHAQKEAVVLANDEISHLVVIYTSLNVFHHRAAGYSLAATTDRLLDVLFTFYRLRGVGEKKPNEVAGIFATERGDISANVYAIHYREQLGSYVAIPDEVIGNIVDGYKKTLSTPAAEWVKNIFTKYEVDYVVWDKKMDPLWNLGQYKFLEKSAEFDGGNLVIYRRM